MILTGPSVSRLLCKGPRPFQSGQVLEGLVAHLSSSARSYSSSPSSHLRGFQRDAISSIRAQFELHVRPTSRRPGLRSQWHERSYATSSPKIVTKFEDLPEDYTDLGGLPYYSRPLTKKEVIALFGGRADPAVADKLLRVLQGRRVAGTLQDPSLPLPHPMVDKAMKVTALKWLRRNIVVDERQSAGLRAEMELEAMGEDISAPSGRSIREPYTPQAKNSPNSRSVLDAVRVASERDWQEKVAKRDALRAKQEAEMVHNPGTLATYDERGVELRRPGENELLKHYTALAAKVVPDTPPEMSNFQRLWPSALVTIGVVIGCVVFSDLYQAPDPSKRLFKDIPPAAATLIPIVAFNALICLAWHHPPAWRILNKYFLSVPGYPRALAVLGNAFSHQSFSHLLINMATLSFLGVQLHDAIGRGNFLAFYFGTAATASFAALTFYVTRGRFHVSTLGASSVVYATMTGLLYMYWNTPISILTFDTGITGNWWLSLLIAYELWAVKRGKGAGPHDHIAHLGGALAGVVGMEAIKRREASRAAARRRLRQTSLGRPLN